MGIERIMQYECRVCGRRLDVTRTGDVYEEPIYCCGMEAAAVKVPEQFGVAAPAPKKPAAKKPVKKAVKKAAKKPARKKAAKKAVKKAVRKAVKKKAAKKAVKKASKKAKKKR